MSISLALLASSVLSLQGVAPPGSDEELVLREVSQPIGYVLAARTDCGADFRIEISTHGATSRIIMATANGLEVVFQTDKGVPLADLIRDAKVIGLLPSRCGPSTPSMELTVKIYDAKRDAMAGQNGEATIRATATAAD